MTRLDTSSSLPAVPHLRCEERCLDSVIQVTTILVTCGVRCSMRTPQGRGGGKSLKRHALRCFRCLTVEPGSRRGPARYLEFARKAQPHKMCNLQTANTDQRPRRGGSADRTAPSGLRRFGTAAAHVVIVINITERNSHPGVSVKISSWHNLGS